MSSSINGNCQIPEMIVVAIPNTDRTRDLSPTHITVGLSGQADAWLESSGGGDAFLKFIRDELFPQIDSKFHTQPVRILVGHSLGGLLAIHTLLAEPEMFQAYVAIDPALFWDNQLLTRQAENKISAIKRLRKTVYISSANTPPLLDNGPIKMRKAIRKFVKTLEAARTENFRLGFQYFDSEDHASVPLLSLYHGLLYIFEGYTQSDLESLPALQAHFKRLSKRLGGDVLPGEGYVNRLGYTLLYRRKDVKKAIAVFEYNLARFPRSANVYDSLGEACLIAGDKARALKNYKKSLILDPNNRNAATAIRKLIEKPETASA